MSRSSLRRLLTVAASTAVLAGVAAPSPALAGDFFFSKSSGTQVFTSWLEIGDENDALAGNAHFGEMFVEDRGRGRAFVSATIFDVQCEEGVDPYLPDFGGHGEGALDEAPAEDQCSVVGLRFLHEEQVTFRIDRKLTSATLTGTLAVGDDHGGVTGSVPVDITWVGVGSTYSERMSGTFTDEYGTYSYRYTFSGRDADVVEGSRIGQMVFDDEAGEGSQSHFGKYRESSRSRG